MDLELYKFLAESNANAPKLSKLLAEIQGEIRGVKKNAVSTVGGGTKVGYVTGDKLYKNLIPALSSREILTHTSVVETANTPRIVATSKGNKLKFEFSGTMHLQFILGTETISAFYPVYGDQFDDTSKSMGTAMTYSDRYGLLKYFKIETDKDDADKKKQPDVKVITPAIKKAPVAAPKSEPVKVVEPKPQVAVVPPKVVSEESMVIVKQLINDMKDKISQEALMGKLQKGLMSYGVTKAGELTPQQATDLAEQIKKEEQ